jgi:hypothetical protein
VSPRDAKLLPRCKCGRMCPVGKRKCARCLSTKGYKVITGKPVTKGKNARGTCLHKAEKPHTRKAKRQNPGGNEPAMVMTKWSWV